MKKILVLNHEVDEIVFWMIKKRFDNPSRTFEFGTEDEFLAGKFTESYDIVYIYDIADFDVFKKIQTILKEEEKKLIGTSLAINCRAIDGEDFIFLKDPSEANKWLLKKFEE